MYLYVTHIMSFYVVLCISIPKDTYTVIRYCNTESIFTLHIHIIHLYIFLRFIHVAYYPSRLVMSACSQCDLNKDKIRSGL